MYSKRLRRRVAKSINQIRDVLNFVDKGPLLDIGCSFGYTICAGERLGLESRGLEYDTEVARHCRSMGYVADTGTMTEMPYKSGEFQIVVMKHVLEHTHHPQMALSEVRRVMRVGGGLFIAVPDARYWKSVRNPYKYHFYNYSCPITGHCIYYTPDTLPRLLKDNGFRVVSVHPQLIHRTAPKLLIAAQTVALPLHWLLEKLRDVTHLRKEFWVVAVKE
jgi:SAM-dependent methyltransferase